MAQNVPTTFTERKHDSDEPGEDESFLRVRTAPLELLMCTLCGAVAACCWRECGTVWLALALHMSIDARTRRLLVFGGGIARVAGC